MGGERVFRANEDNMARVQCLVFVLFGLVVNAAVLCADVADAKSDIDRYAEQVSTAPMRSLGSAVRRVLLDSDDDDDDGDDDDDDDDDDDSNDCSFPDDCPPGGASFCQCCSCGFNLCGCPGGLPPWEFLCPVCEERCKEEGMEFTKKDGTKVK